MLLKLVFIVALVCACIVSVSTEPNCTFNSECGVNAYCQPVDSTCTCNKGFITTDSKDICNYKQKTKLEAFLLSFFAGGFGVDWFILAQGNANYNVAGAFKLLTLGGLGVWWLVDWIRILVGAFPDGQGHSLADW